MCTVSLSQKIKQPEVKLTIHMHLVPRSRVVEFNFQYVIQIHGVVLN
jgi:hypothetical protein